MTRNVEDGTACSAELAKGLRVDPALADALAGSSDAGVRAFPPEELERDERMAMRFAARFPQVSLLAHV